MQLNIFHNTTFTVVYANDSQESFTVGGGQTYADHRDIRVLFYGPVVLSDTGYIYERGSTITVQRTNGVMRWNVRLGTPFDDSFHYEDDTPETDLPTGVVEAVHTFIHIFEKGKS